MKFTPVSLDEEKRLLPLMYAGDVDARNILLTSCLPIISSYAKKYYPAIGTELGDLFSILAIKVMEEMVRRPIKPGYRLKQLVVIICMRECLDRVKFLKNLKLVRDPYFIIEYFKDRLPSPPPDRPEEMKLLREAVASLPADLRDCFTTRFDVDNVEIHTLPSIVAEVDQPHAYRARLIEAINEVKAYISNRQPDFSFSTALRPTRRSRRRFSLRVTVYHKEKISA